MSFDFLSLVNRLCYKLNEVPLTSANFAAADGVYNDFKSAINAAIKDICNQQDNEWPFLWQKLEFYTSVGGLTYNKATSMFSVDWDSFYITLKGMSIDTLTQVAGVATATVSAGHKLKTNDYVYITGVNEQQYNGYFYITVTSPTVFTYTVDSSAASPATGSPLVYPPYRTKKLVQIEYDKYRKEGELERDTDRIKDTDYTTPNIVVRLTNNNFYISPKADREYLVSYEGFVKPIQLVAHSDVPVIPEEFEEVIVNGAIVHGYFFRDNLEQTQIAQTQYTDTLNDMRRILIPQPTYMRIQD
jgi:hypothetical protein